MAGEKKWVTVLWSIILMLLVLSVSIAVPLVCRPFYYIHINALDLPEKTGFTAEEIREAFDEMMDFCVYGEPFGTGVMKWSEDGMSHFADCAKLFRLDFSIVAISAVGLLLCLFLWYRGLRPASLAGRGPLFWSGSVLAVGFVVIAALVAANFDRAFVIFHQIFFPGKDNWIFDSRTDEIIRVLPQAFFRNCAILIVGVLFLLCAVLAWTDRRLRKAKRDQPKT